MHELEILLIVMVVVFLMGKIFRSLRLPVIFGELLGGIMIGPLMFGLIDPNSETIKLLANLGVFFLMLHAGLETEPSKLLKASKKSILIASGDFVITFAAGFFASQALGFNMTESLFIAVGISGTAIAISVRIFKEYKLQRTKIATTVLSAAIVSDILVLITFSVLLQVFESGSINFAQFVLLLSKIVAFFLVVIIAGSKLQKYLAKFFSKKGFTLTLVIALGLGMIAELIGLHLIIGAFLAGLFIREEILDEKIYKKIEDRIYGLSYGFLAPIFFLSLAFHLDLKGLFSAPSTLIILFTVAFLAKFIGSGLMAKIQKISTQKSAIIGIAMNSRGAVDLIIASIGFEMGLINQEVFSILVIIALASTLFAILIIVPLKRFGLIKNE